MQLDEQVEMGHLFLKERKCRTCGLQKNLIEDYYLSRKDSTLASSYAYECKACTIKRTCEYNLKNRPHRKSQELERHYGITLSQFNKMLEEQHNACAICGALEPGGKWKNFHVDHDPQRDTIRGLLCSSCNTAMGLMGGSINNFERAVLYLKESKEKNERH